MTNERKLWTALRRRPYKTDPWRFLRLIASMSYVNRTYNTLGYIYDILGSMKYMLAHNNTLCLRHHYFLQTECFS